MILTSIVGTNDQLIERVAALYLKDGDEIADVTYGRGVFWKRADLSRVRLHPSDIAPASPQITRHDFRRLPYGEKTFNVVVLDPPYMHGGATVKASISKCYGNRSAHTKAASHEAIIKLYADGMDEAERVLKPEGLLWVKCQDEIESGHQRWSHIELWEIARNLGMEALDLFVLVQATVPARRLNYQHHARKNHSYLWVFKKPNRKAKP